MQPTDEADTTEALADVMDLRWGDVFTWNGEPYKVEVINTDMHPSDRDSMTVSDPTVNHPQNSRYGSWGVPLFEVFKDWLAYNVHPGRVEVSTDE